MCSSIDRSKCMFSNLRSCAASSSILSSSMRRKNFRLPIWKSWWFSCNAALSVSSYCAARVFVLSSSRPKSVARLPGSPAMNVGRLWRAHSRKHMSKACLNVWVCRLTPGVASSSSLLGGGGGGNGCGGGEVGVGELVAVFVSNERRRRWAHSTRARLYLAHAWWRLATSLRRFSEWRSCCLSCRDNISFLAESWATKHFRCLISLRRAFNTGSTWGCIHIGFLKSYYFLFNLFSSFELINSKELLQKKYLYISHIFWKLSNMFDLLILFNWNYVLFVSCCQMWTTRKPKRENWHMKNHMWHSLPNKRDAKITQKKKISSLLNY